MEREQHMNIIPPKVDFDSKEAIEAGEKVYGVQWVQELRKFKKERKNSSDIKEFNESIFNPRFERSIFFGDTQIPDQDQPSIDIVKEVIKDFKPHNVWLMGDMMNFSTVSTYGYPADYKISLNDEVEQARVMLREISDIAKAANPNVKLVYLEGNHEYRLKKFIDNKMRELYALKDPRGQHTLAVEKMRDVENMGYSFVPYQENEIDGDAIVMHGDSARSKGGYTAHGYLDRFGQSTVAGHTHRLALVFKTQRDEVRFGIETGSLCKPNMKIPYTRYPDWQLGFGTMVNDTQTGLMHPSITNIQKGACIFNGKFYEGNQE